MNARRFPWLQLALAIAIAVAGIFFWDWLQRPDIDAIRERNNRLAADSGMWVEERRRNDQLVLAYRKLSYDFVQGDRAYDRLLGRVRQLVGDSALRAERVTALLAANAQLEDRLAGMAAVERDEAGGIRAMIALRNDYPQGSTAVDGTVEILQGADSARAELDVRMSSSMAVDWQRGEDLVSTCTVTPGHPKLTISELECAELPDPIEEETRSGVLSGFLEGLRNPLSWLERALVYGLGRAGVP